MSTFLKQPQTKWPIGSSHMWLVAIVLDKADIDAAKSFNLQWWWEEIQG